MSLTLLYVDKVIDWLIKTVFNANDLLDVVSRVQHSNWLLILIFVASKCCIIRENLVIGRGKLANWLVAKKVWAGWKSIFMTGTAQG